MNLKLDQMNELYEEVMDVRTKLSVDPCTGEFLVKGKFLVKTEKDLRDQALEFLLEEGYIPQKAFEYEDEYLKIRKTRLDIEWKGAGIYCFWGVDYNEHLYRLRHIEWIFDELLQIDPLLFLGDNKVVEEVKGEWSEGKYGYAVWINGCFQYIFARLQPLGIEEIKAIIDEYEDELNQNALQFSIREVSTMHHKEIYQIIKREVFSGVLF